MHVRAKSGEQNSSSPPFYLLLPPPKTRIKILNLRACINHVVQLESMHSSLHSRGPSPHTRFHDFAIHVVTLSFSHNIPFHGSIGGCNGYQG